MNKQRAMIYGVVLAVLAGLVYLQFRIWRTFDWATFSSTDRAGELAGTSCTASS